MAGGCFYLVKTNDNESFFVCYALFDTCFDGVDGPISLIWRVSYCVSVYWRLHGKVRATADVVIVFQYDTVVCVGASSLGQSKASGVQPMIHQIIIIFPNLPAGFIICQIN